MKLDEQKLNTDISKLIPEAAKADEITDIEASIKRYGQEAEMVRWLISDLEKRAEANKAEITKHENVEEEYRNALIDQKGLEIDRDRFGDLAKAANIKLGKAQEQLELINAKKAEVRSLRVQKMDLMEQRSEWEILEKAFGKQGIQSLEIDAAGPAVSDMANDLLYNCFGSRFSINFVTQRLKSDKKGFTDEFDIVVTDSERGRMGSAGDLSGGEKIIISEAISLAVALFNRSKSGVAWDTLFRDEVTGALDTDNAPAYIQMLRRAKELGHFKRVYFISHQPQVQELADSCIQLSENGQISII